MCTVSSSLSLVMPFILTSIDEKMKLFEFLSRAFLPSLLIKTLFLGQLEQTRLDLFTVSPIKENCGLVSPTSTPGHDDDNDDDGGRNKSQRTKS